MQAQNEIGVERNEKFENAKAAFETNRRNFLMIYEDVISASAPEKLKKQASEALVDAYHLSEKVLKAQFFPGLKEIDPQQNAFEFMGVR